MRRPAATIGGGTPPLRVPVIVLTTVSLSPISAMLPGLSCGAVYVTVKGFRSPAGTLTFMLSTLSPATITEPPEHVTAGNENKKLSCQAYYWEPLL